MALQRKLSRLGSVTLLLCFLQVESANYGLTVKKVLGAFFDPIVSERMASASIFEPQVESANNGLTVKKVLGAFIDPLVSERMASASIYGPQVESANNGLTLKKVMGAFIDPLVSERMASASIYGPQDQKVRIVNLKYERCGPESDPGRVDKLEITSTPNGDAIVTLSATTDVDLQSPVQVTVEVYKSLLGSWIRVPCFRHYIGSCKHKDICQHGFNECPFEILRTSNVPCSCPIMKGTYTLNEVKIPAFKLFNARMLVGDYKVKVVSRVGDTQLACYNGSGTVELHNI